MDFDLHLILSHLLQFDLACREWVRADVGECCFPGGLQLGNPNQRNLELILASTATCIPAAPASSLS